MIARKELSILGACLSVFVLIATAKPSEVPTIPAGSKVFISPMNGFETYLKAAMQKKQVPLQIVEDKDSADFIISGESESQKASTAKKIIMGSWHSKEEASINVANAKTGEVVFAYAVHKENSAHGKQTSAEACAKHLKDAIKSH
jgi:hypothetical protein